MSEWWWFGFGRKLKIGTTLLFCSCRDSVAKRLTKTYYNRSMCKTWEQFLRIFFTQKMMSRRGYTCVTLWKLNNSKILRIKINSSHVGQRLISSLVDALPSSNGFFLKSLSHSRMGSNPTLLWCNASHEISLMTKLTRS